ncbi:NAD dependent epimerase/dehydratase [Xylariaceae sp. FL1019]|nr:NAD dependent epimerase/dehydratase [Xylariaceae sp. FL1019]
MPKVLLTGGSGFIAAHVLALLLERGHDVVTTVRSEEKADKIRAAYPNAKLTVVIVPDIAQPGAFDEVMQTPGLEYVQHTASPFHYNFTDPKTELLDPAIKGTTSALEAVQKYAPTVKRVVITSSFAAILKSDELENMDKTWSEADWNPNTYGKCSGLSDTRIRFPSRDRQDGVNGPPAVSYRVSKTLAEKAAWDFKKDKNPNFDVATINPPLVFGPVVHHLNSLSNINTSNERIVHCITGKWKADNQIPATGVHFFVDVRDVAKAHVEAMERPEAGGNRFFTTGGYVSNREFVPLVRKEFPQLADKLPDESVKGGDYPNGKKEGTYKYDNSKATKQLGIEWISLEKSVVDTVKSLLEIGV